MFSLCVYWRSSGVEEGLKMMGGMRYQPSCVYVRVRVCSLSVLVWTYELLKVCLSCTCYLEEVSALREFNKSFSFCCSGCFSFLEGCGGMFHNHPGTDWELLLGKLGKQVTWVRLCFNIWTPVGHGNLLTSTEVASCSSQGCCGEGWRRLSAEAHSVLPPLVLRFSFSCWYWLNLWDEPQPRDAAGGSVEIWGTALGLIYYCWNFGWNFAFNICLYIICSFFPLEPLRLPVKVENLWNSDRKNHSKLHCQNWVNSYHLYKSLNTRNLNRYVTGSLATWHL